MEGSGPLATLKKSSKWTDYGNNVPPKGAVEQTFYKARVRNNEGKVIQLGAKVAFQPEGN
jgi:hypothetical protein